ncbi:hypothetical protein CEXT_272851 [Caerostris extrusa]|uniref:Secreted protein n=1 Tax=Caerostris extrusa TaxID=172846 RepID=A0AAV4VH65_CAEEX|nr:hypothetical protein CEXT_272851 [Caerostris extrusa]
MFRCSFVYSVFLLASMHPESTGSITGGCRKQIAPRLLFCVACRYHARKVKSVSGGPLQDTLTTSNHHGDLWGTTALTAIRDKQSIT